jgi:pimeloyl-ACP methyl ester carboxylesterase
MPIPFAPVEFTTSGNVADQSQVDDALALLSDQQVTDLLIVSHGWNNDMAAARRLYDQIRANLESLVPDSSSARPAVLGVFWPSVRWADDDQIAGGGVAVGDEQTELAAAIGAAVDDADLAARLREATADLDTADGRARFVEAARRLLAESTDAVTDDEDGAPSALVSSDPDEVFSAVRDAVVMQDDGVMPAGPPSDLAPGIAPDLLAEPDTAGAGLFGLSWPSLARQVLNTFTYYTMKARAGDVGARGVAPLIDRVNASAQPPRVHLAGHSFGARVVAAAATAATTPIASLTLLQGAFSHYGFTKDYADTGKDGAFVQAVDSGRILGPVVITHTHNDKAVGLAYAIASRLARQAGAGLGDRSDLYGGIGANGSVGTDAVEARLLDRDGTYTLAGGRIHNLLADDHISGHSDVTNPAVVNALAQAMGVR